MMKNRFESSTNEAKVLLVEESVYGGGKVYFGAERAGLREIGVHLEGTQVHALIEALKPYAVFEPRTVRDGEGDFWIEQEYGIFRLEDSTATLTLDQIEKEYGIDGESGPEPEPAPAFQVGDRVSLYDGRKGRVAATHPDRDAFEVLVDGYTFPSGCATDTKGAGTYSATSLTEIDEEPFQAGDRVSLTGPHWIADDRRDRTYDEAPDGEGSLATVVNGAASPYGPAAARVRWDGNGGVSVVASGSLTKVDEPEPVVVFEKGDRVRITGNSSGNPAGAHVLKIGAEATVKDASPRFAGTVEVEGRSATSGLSVAQWLLPSDLEKIEPEPLAAWERELLGMAEEVAEVTETPEVSVEWRDPAVRVWEDLVTPVPTFQARAILGKASRSVFAPEPEEIVPVFQVGDRVKVVDASGSSERARVGDVATVTRVGRSRNRPEGPLTGVKTDDGRAYSMFAMRFEKVEEPEWKVGDRVRLIDDGGDNTSTAKVGDEGEIVDVDDDGETLLRVRMDDGHETTRFDHRWEIAPAPVTERDGFRVGDRVKGYGAVGRITKFRSPGTPGGDVLVAWETGGGLAGLTLGATLSHLSPVCAICGPERCMSPGVLLVRR